MTLVIRILSSIRNSTICSIRLLQQVKAIDRLMLRRRDMIRMLMNPITDDQGQGLRDSDDNDDDEVTTLLIIVFEKLPMLDFQLSRKKIWNIGWWT